MSMTLEEMKLAVCEKLPELIERYDDNTYFKHPDGIYRILNWPTEGLQVCHEAEKLLNDFQHSYFYNYLILMRSEVIGATTTVSATYEQRLKALCLVWWPEKFN